MKPALDLEGRVIAVAGVEFLSDGQDVTLWEPGRR